MTTQQTWFTGKRIALTGGMMDGTRKKLSGLVVSLGGEVTDHVSRTTSLVVATRDDTTKAKRAKYFGVPVITEKEFACMVGLA